MQYSRREFIKLGGLTAGLAALAACSKLHVPGIPATGSGMVGQSVPADDLLIPSTLRRILFAATPADLDRARQIGLDNFIDEQLAPESLPDVDLARRLASYDTLGMDAPQLAQVSPRQKPGQQLAQAALVRAVYSNRQLYELMVDFWSNHFNIYLGKGIDRYLKTIDDREVIRPHALGKFADLLSASAHSPAMLIYLDNALSNKTAPNENYARELMELHTLSVNGGYTQADVHEVARAFTGWTVAGLRGPQPGTFLFNAHFHDDGAKQILGRSFPAGQGIHDGEQLLALLAEAPATAQFISRKLVARFVADEPPEALVARAAATFTQTGGDIARVLGTILHSAEFQASLGTKIKRPFEFIASAVRASGAAFQPELPTLAALRGMGQPLFGWESPNGYPDAGQAWINTSGVLSRWNYALSLATGALKDTQLDLASLAPNPTNAAAGIDTLSLRLLGMPLPGPERQVLLDFAGASPFEAVAPALAALIFSTSNFFYR